MCLPDHYTITWFLWIACNQQYFNQALKQELKEHGGKETVNGLRYSYSGSAVLLALFSPTSRDQNSYETIAGLQKIFGS